MKKMLKRIVILLIIVLVVYFFDIQHDYYVNPDIINFTLNEYLFIGGILFLIFLMFFLWVHSSEKRWYAKFGNAFFFSLFMLIPSYFLLLPAFVSSTLFINRMYSNKTITKVYKVSGNSEYKVFFFSYINYKGDTELIHIKSKFPNINVLNIEKEDSISIQFEKGLFNYNYINFKKTKIIKPH